MSLVALRFPWGILRSMDARYDGQLRRSRDILFCVISNIFFHLSRGSIDKITPARVGTGFIRRNLPRRADAVVGRGGEGVAERR